MTEVLIDSRQSVVVNRRLRRMLTIIVALAVAMAEWFVLAKLIGVDLVVNQGGIIGPVHAVQVGIAPVASGLSAWLLLALLERVQPSRAVLVWRIVAVGVMVSSLWSPVTMATTVSTALWLASMHLVVGAILIIGLPGTRSLSAR